MKFIYTVALLIAIVSVSVESKASPTTVVVKNTEAAIKQDVSCTSTEGKVSCDVNINGRIYRNLTRAEAESMAVGGVSSTDSVNSSSDAYGGSSFLHFLGGLSALVLYNF